MVDAYLSPILRRYVDQVAAELGGTRLLFMQSSGGLTDARLFQGKDSIVSGPAGGVVGVVRTTVNAGFQKVIGFDMGGTSTDTAHYAGEFEVCAMFAEVPQLPSCRGCRQLPAALRGRHTPLSESDSELRATVPMHHATRYTLTPRVRTSLGAYMDIDMDARV